MTTTPSVNVTGGVIGDNESAFLAVAVVPIYIVSIILSALSLYVLVALTFHRIRVKKMSKQHKSIKVAVKFAKTGTSPWLDNLSMAAAVCCVLNCTSDHPIVFTREVSSITCKVMQLFNFVFYSCGIACLYSFLWIRQRACYQSPSLAQVQCRLARILSLIILPLFLAMMVAGMILTGALWCFESSPDGCVETERTRAPLVVLYAGSVTMQLTLLLLFVYPLKRHTAFLFGGSELRTTDRLLVSLVKRSLITTSLCVLADTAAFTIAILLPHNIPFIIINYTYDANLLCNVICLIGSFADWKKRIVPWCSREKKTREISFTSSKYSSSVKTTTTSTL